MSSMNDPASYGRSQGSPVLLKPVDIAPATPPPHPKIFPSNVARPTPCSSSAKIRSARNGCGFPHRCWKRSTGFSSKSTIACSFGRLPTSTASGWASTDRNTAAALTELQHEAKDFHIEMHPTDEAGFRKLENGRIDGIYSNRERGSLPYLPAATEERALRRPA